MKRFIVIFAWLSVATTLMADMQPVFMETFDRCIDAEDENYGYTGGNDEQWGGFVRGAGGVS